MRPQHRGALGGGECKCVPPPMPGFPMQCPHIPCSLAEPLCSPPPSPLRLRGAVLSSTGWRCSGQPHPVQRDVGLLTSELAVTHAPPAASWGLALQLLGQQMVKHSAWSCAVSDTLGMCPGSAKAGLREEVGNIPGLTKGLDHAWKMLLEAAASKPIQSSDGLAARFFLCCTDIADACRKISDSNSNGGCKAQLVWGLVAIYVYMLSIIPCICMVTTDFSI